MALAGGFGNLVDATLQAFGSTATVTLRDGTTFTIIAAIGKRRNTDVTAGLDQTEKVVIVDKADWDNKAGRAPNKGDKFELLDQKLAVTKPDTKGASGSAVAYKCVVKG